MPVFIDFHNISKKVDLNSFTSVYYSNLKIEQPLNCKCVTFWIDKRSRNAYSLVEAPNKKAVLEMYTLANNKSPERLIEVSRSVVERFLGEIKTSVENGNTTFRYESPLRVLMVIETSSFLNRLESNQFSLFSQKFHNSVSKSIRQFKGSVVERDNYSYLVSFKSVSNAVFCAQKIQANFKYITPKFDLINRKMKIGLAAGLPLTNTGALFEETITLVRRIGAVVAGELVATNEVKELYEEENTNAIIDSELIRILKTSDELFLSNLMEVIERNWNSSSFTVTGFSKGLDLTKSQLYRKLGKFTNSTPNKFIKEFRLHKALNLLHNREGNISRIAHKSGFNSLAYFSKCFFNKYGVLPSKYIQQHLV